MTKAKKITLISVLCVFLLLGTAVLIWYFGDSYGQFYSLARKEFEIAGLSQGFTPQGMCYEKNYGYFIYSGYMKDGSASRIYLYDKSNAKNIKYITLRYDDGSAYVGHAGGIDTDGINVWVAGDKKLCHFLFSDLFNAECGEAVVITDELDMPNGADFLKYDNNCLWVGEFHKDNKHDTDNSHFVDVDGGQNKAISFCYRINNLETCAIDETPIKALSTTSLVQGMEIYGNKIILSTSFSLPNSHIYTYEQDLNGATEKTFNFNGTNIDLYVLDNTNLISDLEAPCMSEEVAISGGRVYILFESACQKYGFVTREALKNVYSYELV